MKLSIIIPSYNMESKINKCLDSILNQNADKSEYEIIVIDSSIDNSEKFLVEYAKKYKNVKIIKSKKRKTCGTSRNIGVNYAAGDYVYCVDIDDWLADDCLSKILEKLDGSIDIFYAPYKSLKNGKEVFLKPRSIKEFVNIPVAVWNKIYKRSLYVQQPNYMPEDVVPHFRLIDKCQSVSYFDFLVYVYDNSDENKGAISRTFDFLKNSPQNLLQLAYNNILTKNNLRDEYVVGVIHNLADMYAIRNTFKNQDVKVAFMQRFFNIYRNFMTGIYIH